MKRLNPNTGLPFKRGDLRKDGYTFYAYQTFSVNGKTGYFTERWLSPQSIQKQKVNEKKHRDNRLNTKQGQMQHILWSAKCRAKKQNIPFDLSIDYLLSLPSENCPALGLRLSWGERNKTIKPYSPSLDKIDPNKGYVKGNVQWLSQLANAMKQNATPTQLKSFANWVLNS